MVTPTVEVGLVGEVPTPEGRVPLVAEVGGGVRVGRFDLGLVLAVGVAIPDDDDWESGLGVGWEGVGGMRAGMRLPSGPVSLRPTLEVAAEHRVQPLWYDGLVVQRDGVLVLAGLDLVLSTSAESWIAGGVVGGWSTIDAAPRVGVGLRVGTAFGRRAAGRGGPG